MAGAVVAAIFAAVAFAPASALAQESEDETADNPFRGFRLIRGAGIATDVSTGDDMRSGFRVAAQLADDESTPEREHSIIRGTIAVAVDGERVQYTFVPDTWTAQVSEDGNTFEAAGTVQDEDGNEYTVSLTGYFGMHMRQGTIWSLEGTLSGGDTEYELHYAAISNPLRQALRHVP
jgi:hypothetical protein